jgi:hypothetical protein
MSRENKGKPPRPQLTPRQVRIWQDQQRAIAKLQALPKSPRLPVDPLTQAIAEAQRGFQAGQEKTPEPTTAPTTEPVAEPVNESTVTQSSSKRKSGPRRIEWPHLPEALKALGQKWPDITEVEARHINFVIKHLRQKGDDLAYELTEAGDKDERQRRTVRRRIEEWLETRRGNLSR